MTKAKKAVKIPANYDPTKDKTYMSAKMLAFFKGKLVDWKAELTDETRSSVMNMQEESISYPDPADTAAANADRQFELRSRDRARKLIHKIDQALARVEEGEYGYCEHTGDEIGVGRLLARPVATLSIEAQEAHEKGEKTRAG
jgi:DnaK suppressor protein